MEFGRKLKKQGQIDFPLMIVLTLICGFGLVMLFSASYYYAQSRNMENGYYYINNQAMYMAVGFVGMYVISRIDYHWWDKVRVIGLVGTLVLMAAVLLVGVERNGAKRWLEIGQLSLQPSEFAKFALVLYMAAFMSRKPNTMKSFTKGIVPMLLIIAVICVFLLLQDNLSMMIILVLAGMVMLFLGGARVKHLLLMAVTVAPVAFMAAYFEPYRWARITMFSDPWTSAESGAYQLRQSLIGFGAGGLFGSGLNFSRQKLLFLPYGESDFIFSIIGEELGFAGCVLLIAAYVFVIYRGIRIAIRCKDRFGSLLAAGITSVLAIQVLVNMAVATSTIPPTGQTLPFISSGGSSLLIFLAAMGILLNISRNIE